MKRTLHLLIFWGIINTIFAQAPQMFKYQAVARNSDGSVLANQTVAFCLSIIEGSSTGTTVYVERHVVMTNQAGIANLIIGAGTVLNGNFTNINWANNDYFLRVDLDPLGGTAYIHMGTSQLLSVPYALFAKETSSSNYWLKTGDNIYSGNIGNIGIGTNVPERKLHIQTTNGASAAKIGYSQLYYDNRLFFGDGEYVYIGEKDADDRLYLRGGSLSIDLGGNLGLSGQVLTSNGTTATWQNLPSNSSVWNTSGLNIYNTNTGNVGVGTTSPTSKLEVKGTSSLPNDTLFQVKDYQGNTVFAVFPDGVRVIIDEASRAAAGGFAVSGRSSNRALTGDYFLVKPDSTRVYVKEGSRAAAGGFAVSGRSSNRPTTSNYMNITSKNYFIGHESGSVNTTGQYNSFLGYKAGKSNVSGNSNIFIGFNSGYSNVAGEDNIFIGNNSGYYNVGIGAFTGDYNIFIGDMSGYNNTAGISNVFIGDLAGIQNTTGRYNVFMGKNAGATNTTGNFNTYIGAQAGGDASSTSNTYLGNMAGYMSTGSGNVFIGNQAGYNTTESGKLIIQNNSSLTPLIIGDFASGKLGISRNPTDNALEVNGNASKTVAGLWLANSDKRIKTDIQNIDNACETLMKLRPVKYKYTAEWKAKNPSIKDQYYYNYIAQEFQQVFPESVKSSGEYIQGDSEPILQIDAYNAIIVTTKAVQELILKLATYEEQIKQLQKKVEMLEQSQTQQK